MNIKDVLNNDKKEVLNKDDEDEDDWGGSDDWGATAPKELDLGQVDLKHKDLNKLSDADLAAHKRAMDKDFGKN